MTKNVQSQSANLNSDLLYVARRREQLTLIGLTSPALICIFFGNIYSSWLAVFLVIFVHRWIAFARKLSKDDRI